MKIYTKSGDDGTTGLYGGSRIAKDSARIDAIGDVDELNAAIGLARSTAVATSLGQDLAKIQNWLFDLGAALAAPPGGKLSAQELSEETLGFLEDSMDRQSQELSPLKNFILPGGCRLSAELHFARCVCRRTERAVLALHRHDSVSEVARKFLNRLSDWLFVSARTANRLSNVEDIIWSQEVR